VLSLIRVRSSPQHTGMTLRRAAKHRLLCTNGRQSFGWQVEKKRVANHDSRICSSSPRAALHAREGRLAVYVPGLSWPSDS
jgi:hypothetical protein